MIFVILWLAASSAWANSLTGLRNAASLDVVIKYNSICSEGKLHCSKGTEAGFGQLISSVVSIVACRYFSDGAAS